jgi:predicted site-specific integrase-resolvase
MICYTSSKDQKEDLARQAELLGLDCCSLKYELIKYLGSGINYYKKGLKNLINQILSKKVKRLVRTHKDRLLRFGAELIFAICEIGDIEVVRIRERLEEGLFN